MGVSFHVGSGFHDATGLIKAIHSAKIVWIKLIQFGFKPKILDIGGGFHGAGPILNEPPPNNNPNSEFVDVCNKSGRMKNLTK